MAAMSGCATEIDTGEAPVSADTTVVVDANTTTTMAGPTVGYVRITWRQDLDVRCTTPETFDNNGADSAVIEVWGPTDDGRWRADMIAPSGETEVVIADVAEDGTVLQSWGTYNRSRR